MTLIVDTGVLYASLDRRDPDHESCRDLIESFAESLVVPAPVLAEVDYFMSRQGGSKAMARLIRDVHAGAFAIEDLAIDDYARVAEVLDRYSDLDVGFVDAAVLAVIERLGERRLATLDRRHFSVLRPRHVDALELLP